MKKTVFNIIFFKDFSAKTTLLTCLQRYFDLQQVPKRSFFEMLGYYSTNPPEKERLQELASPEGLDDYLDYANRSRRTTAEALRDFVATSKNLKPGTGGKNQAKLD